MACPCPRLVVLLPARGVRQTVTLEALIKTQELSGTRLENLLRRIKANKSLMLLDPCKPGAYQPPLGARHGGQPLEGHSITKTEKYAIARCAKLSGRVVLAVCVGKEDPRITQQLFNDEQVPMSMIKDQDVPLSRYPSYRKALRFG